MLTTLTAGQQPTLGPKIRYLFLFALFLLPCVVKADSASKADSPRLVVHVYSEPGCPYCQRAKSFLRDQARKLQWLRVIDHDIQSDALASKQFEALNRRLGVKQPGVPLILVGPRPFIGFDAPETTGAQVIEAARQCIGVPCRDLYEEVTASLSQPRYVPPASDTQSAPVTRPSLPDQIDLPVIGEVNTRALSLPVLTVLLAAVDGFNPCAMWVLVFLIGLLLGMENKARMWILGGTFLFTSALVYFLFLSAWLNIFLLLGALLWIRIAVGGFALVGGAYYLREFALNPDAVCKVTNSGERRTIMDALKRTVQEEHFWLALAGIVVLAAAVNLIELLCSAGLPAVFTNVLSLSDLPTWQYYAYLLLYISVFLADDAIIFITAMVTLQATGLTASYSRYSHLIGGTAMVIIGVLLIFRPDWLAFN